MADRGFAFSEGRQNQTNVKKDSAAKAADKLANSKGFTLADDWGVAQKAVSKSGTDLEKQVDWGALLRKATKG